MLWQKGLPIFSNEVDRKTYKPAKHANEREKKPRKIRENFRKIQKT